MLDITLERGTTITYSDAIEALEKAVANRGREYTYPHRRGNASCHYRWDLSDYHNGVCALDEVGQPACLVGQAWFNLGILDQLVPGTQHGWFPENDQQVDAVITRACGRGDLDITAEAWTAFEIAQAYNDSGSEWGEAYDHIIRDRD